MNFYEELLECYSSISFPSFYDDLSKLGKNIAWYLADQTNTLVCSNNHEQYLLEIDIKSAFPTICECLYPNTDFVHQIQNLNEKLKKNIYIATTLKGDRLKQLNTICKIVILGIIFDTIDEFEKDNITIFELKKDGCVISCNQQTLYRLQNLKSTQNNFTQLLINNNFIFHIDMLEFYIRSNRTSFYFMKHDDIIQLKLKGLYKHCPEYLKNKMCDLLINKENKESLLKIYNEKFLTIIKTFNLNDLLNQFFMCGNNMVLNEDGDYEKIKINTKIYPRMYIKLFVFPIILANLI